MTTAQICCDVIEQNKSLILNLNGGDVTNDFM